MENIKLSYKPVVNSCTLCNSLGANIVYRGIKGCIPLVHGSQGCATYLRRYLISHFREPIDIASSNFSEDSTIFGGANNLKKAIKNIITQYHPEVIGISSTCLTETIGDDINMIVKEYKSKNHDMYTELLSTSTPSFIGSHVDGFYRAIKSVLEQVANDNERKKKIVNIFPSLVSTADLRNLKEIFIAYKLNFIMFPDYSDSLDNPNWTQYKKIPLGGTSIEEIKKVGSSKYSIEMGTIFDAAFYVSSPEKSSQKSAGEYLQDMFGVPNFKFHIPIGVKLTDKFFDLMGSISKKTVPKKYLEERGRLIDAYSDGHKFVSYTKVAVYQDEDLLVGLVTFLDEIGVDIRLVATGGKSGKLKTILKELTGKEFNVVEGVDFEDIDKYISGMDVELMIGSSKGYYISKKMRIPLVRVGFPIQDRLGGQRVEHLFYSGTQNLFDRIVNVLIEKRQNESKVGYKTW